MEMEMETETERPIRAHGHCLSWLNFPSASREVRCENRSLSHRFAALHSLAQ